jgi:tetratricopeptide (TPR) repeat protein
VGLVLAKLDRASPDPTFPLRVGRLLLDLEQPERAIPLLEGALEHPASSADARYFLGVALELAGEHGQALEHLLAVHTSDLETAQPSWALDGEAFGKLVDRVLASIANPYGEQLREASRRIAASPPLELVCEGFDPRAAVFLAGMPVRADDDGTAAETTAAAAETAKKRRRVAAAREASGEQRLSCLFIYKRNVERFAGSEAMVAGELHRALIGELGFFFGLSDAEVDALFDQHDQLAQTSASTSASGALTDHISSDEPPAGGKAH